MADTLLVGRDSGDYVFSDALGYVRWEKFVAGQSGVAASFHIYCIPGSGENAKVAVYSDSENEVGTLLASGESPIEHGTWNIIPLSGGANIVAGVNYWLGATGDGYYVVSRYADGGIANRRQSGQLYSAYAWIDNPITTLGGTGSYGFGVFAGYGGGAGRLIGVGDPSMITVGHPKLISAGLSPSLIRGP